MHANDVAKAVAHVLANGGAGHFALQGSQEATVKQLVNMTEQALNKETDSTT